MTQGAATRLCRVLGALLALGLASAPRSALAQPADAPAPVADDALAQETGPPPVRAEVALPPPPQNCEGAPIRAIALTGCPTRVCSSPAVTANLVSLTDIALEQRVTQVELTRAQQRLVKTGFFKGVAFRCAPVAGGFAMTIEADPAIIVRNVEVEGNRYFRETEVTRRVFLRSGSELDVGVDEPLAGSEQVTRQIESIKALYRGAGIEDVEVSIASARVSDTVVDLTIHIQEGPRQSIAEIVARHEQTVTGLRSDLSCPRIPADTIEDAMGVATGDVVTSRTVRQVTQRVRSWFQSVGFINPQVEVVPAGEPLRLTVTVRTDRCWLIRVWERDDAVPAAEEIGTALDFQDPIGLYIRREEAVPFRLVPLDEWRATLPFGESGAFTREEAARGVDAIFGVLQDRGFFFANVTMDHRNLPATVDDAQRDRDPVEGLIDFRLTLNYDRRIQDLIFTGARAFTRDELLAVIETRSYDFLAQGGRLQVGRLFTDLQRLKAFYQARGFYQFRYLLQGEADQQAPRRVFREEGDWLIWEYTFRDLGFKVLKRRQEMVLYVEIPFAEGRRAKVQSVEFQGNASLSDAQALGVFGLRPNESYGSFYLTQALGRLANWYKQRGYHNVAIDAYCRPVTAAMSDEERAAAKCGSTTVTTGDVPFVVTGQQVPLTIVIEEGSQVFVGEVFWRGNFKTHDEILTRDLPSYGVPFNEGDVVEATRKLRNLGVFESVRIDTIGLAENPPRKHIALVVVVVERDYLFLDLAAGIRSVQRANADEQLGRIPPTWASIFGHAVSASDRSTTGMSRYFPLRVPNILFVLQAAYIDENFRGLAHELRIPFEWGFSFQDWLQKLSLKPRWMTPRLFDTDIRLEMTLIAELDRVTEIFDRTEYSLLAVATIPLAERMSVNLEASAGFIRFEDPNDPDPRVEGIEEPTPFYDFTNLDPQFRLATRWRWDEQDNPLHPTSGFALSTSLSGISAQSLEPGDQNVTFSNFLKWELAARGALSVEDIILAGFVRYGGSTASECVPLPANERFTLGGSNGMRGFDDGGVGRYDASGQLLPRPNAPACPSEEQVRMSLGGNVLVNGNFEVRIPVVRPSIWTALFLDMGALAANHAELTPGTFRFSGGVGLRYLLLGQFPIRLDWGAIIGPARCQRFVTLTDGSVTCGGYEPGSRLHVEFLYPF